MPRDCAIASVPCLNRSHLLAFEASLSINPDKSGPQLDCTGFDGTMLFESTIKEKLQVCEIRDAEKRLRGAAYAAPLHLI